MLKTKVSRRPSSQSFNWPITELPSDQSVWFIVEQTSSFPLRLGYRLVFYRATNKCTRSPFSNSREIRLEFLDFFFCHGGVHHLRRSPCRICITKASRVNWLRTSPSVEWHERTVSLEETFPWERWRRIETMSQVFHGRRAEEQGRDRRRAHRDRVSTWFLVASRRAVTIPTWRRRRRRRRKKNVRTCIINDRGCS